MHNAQLDLGVRINRLNCLRKALESIAAGNQDILEAAVFQVNGLIANDKFCFVRDLHLSLSRSRVPLNRRA